MGKHTEGNAVHKEQDFEKYLPHEHEWKYERIIHAGVRPPVEIYRCSCRAMKIVRGDFVHYNYIDGGIV